MQGPDLWHFRVTFFVQYYFIAVAGCAEKRDVFPERECFGGFLLVASFFLFLSHYGRLIALRCYQTFGKRGFFGFQSVILVMF